MRILLFGKNGRIGWELQRSLAPLGELIALGRDDDAPHCGDLTHVERMAASVRTMRPDVIVNAAAYTAVDRAESEPELARSVNAVGPGRLAREAAILGSLLVHYSTDCVFDGSGTAPWDETGPTSPLSVYGQTKLEGEQLIRAAGCPHLILRTSWIHSARRDNFARNVLRMAAERDSLDMVDDQFGSPTGAALVADASANALRLTMLEPRLGGTYHCTASGFVSRYEYAIYVVAVARAAGLPLRLMPQAIRPIPSDTFQSAAKRPLNARLDSRKFCDAFGLNLPDWKIGLRHTLGELNEGNPISGC